MNRRQFLQRSTTAGAAVLAGGAAFATGHRLTMPPLLDTRSSGRMNLTAQAGTTSFIGDVASRTAGFNQAFLGPTVVLQNGPLAARVENTLAEPISAHWHGLLVPGEHDGGPHLPVATGATWEPDMQIAQSPATIWYHSHIHGKTAPQVYAGLAGLIHLTDGRDDERGLPNTYGIDDLSLVIQDRRFDGGGRMVYDPTMMDLMHGFGGNRMMVNGQVGATAAVPAGITRLRLLNGSNGRIYTLHLSDDRPMHLITTDGGFLTAPITVQSLRLAPGERVEVLVDFSDGEAPALMSEPSRPFTVLPFAIDTSLAARIDRLPDVLDGVPLDLVGPAAKTRTVLLEMGMGGGMMGRREFSINGRPFAMDHLNFRVNLGDVERWTIRGAMVAHPFHVHGVVFRVLSENGAAPRPENIGWKDTVLVAGEAEIIARFDQPAAPETPYMFHCHILEHEDAGMMGQFSVT